MEDVSAPSAVAAASSSGGPVPSASVPAPAGGRAAAFAVVAVAWAFVPQEHLESFDSGKLALLAVVAAITTFLLLIRGRRTERVSLRDPVLLLPAALAAAAGVGALVAFPRGAITGPITALAALGIALTLPRGDAAAASLLRFLRAVSIAAVGAGVYAVVQAIGADPAPWGARREVVSTFGNVSFAAEFQAAALCAAIVLAFRKDGEVRRADRALGIAAIAAAVVHLVLARSRIDLIAAGAGGVATLWCVLPNRQTARRVLIGGGVLAAAVAVAFVVALKSGAGFVGRSDTIAVRAHIWSGTLDAILASPFRMGTAPFVDLFPPHRIPEEYRISLGRVADTPHNDLLEIAATTGLIGLAVAVAALRLLARRIVSLRDVAPWRAAPLAGIGTALFVSALASSPLTHPATALLAALVAGHAAALLPRDSAPSFLGGKGPRVATAAILVAGAVPAFAAFSSQAFLALARAERGTENTKLTLRLFDRACWTDPWAVEPRFELGTALSGAGHAEEGLAALREAFERRPGSHEIRTNLVAALERCGKKDEAAALLDESLRLTPWHPLLLAARADRRIAAGDAAGALADLEAAAPLATFEPAIRAKKAEALLAMKPGEESRREALDALDALAGTQSEGMRPAFARAFVARDASIIDGICERARTLAATSPAAALEYVTLPMHGRGPESAALFLEASAIAASAGRPDLERTFAGRALAFAAWAKYDARDFEGALRLAVRAAERSPIPEHFVIEVLCHAKLRNADAAAEALADAVAAGFDDGAKLGKDDAIRALLPHAALEALLARATR